MSNLLMTKKIDAPPSAVFALFTDFANGPGRIKGITKLEIVTPGPIAAGTRFKETRVMFGRECTEEMEITALDPGKSVEIGVHSCGVEFRSMFRFVPDGDGTRVDVEFRTRALTFMAKLMKPLGWLMRGQMKKCVDRDLEDLKKAAEGAAINSYGNK